MDGVVVQRIALAGETDLEGFRRAARRLLALGVEPLQVSWQRVGRGGRAVQPDLARARRCGFRC